MTQRINKTVRYTIRFTQEEKIEIIENAKAAGLSLADYMRKRILNHRVASKMDMQIYHEIRRLGGLLKLVHTESGGAYSVKTAGILDILNAFAKSLAQNKSK
jgi:hypothetical protein